MVDPLSIRHMYIRIHKPDDTFYYFLMRSTTQFDKLVTLYCEKAVSTNYQKVLPIVTIKI